MREIDDNENHDEPEAIYLTDDNGDVHEYEILEKAVFEGWGQFMAVAATAEDDDHLYLFSYTLDDEENCYILEDISEDDFDRVADAMTQLLRRKGYEIEGITEVQ